MPHIRAGDTPHRTASDSDPGAGRLDSWKAIAAYLGRDVTTVQRWEKREGLPVHRHQHEKLGSIFAYQVELDEWRRARAERQADGGVWRRQALRQWVLRGGWLTFCGGPRHVGGRVDTLS